jgi:riboflavin kinase/FMN adenylyltransferase
MLGYDYRLHGVVVAGNRLGRTIGFPTANMQLYEPLKLVPGNGVYFVRVKALDRNLYGMCNIGCRPTVGEGNARTIETNIFDFNEDIYGLDLEITFLARIREEVRFESMEALKVQLEKDREACLAILEPSLKAE